MVYVFLADGFEECEALIPIDILRRGGIKVTTVGVMGKNATGSHNITVVCDKEISEIDTTDNIEAVILPGGMPGSENLYKSDKVKNIVLQSFKENKLICAICAAPLVFGRLGLLKGKCAVCYPGFEQELTGAKIVNSTVVCDGNIITAKGVGAAFDFGYEILNKLTNTPEKTKDLKQTMIYTEE